MSGVSRAETNCMMNSMRGSCNKYTMGKLKIIMCTIATKKNQKIQITRVFTYTKKEKKKKPIKLPFSETQKDGYEDVSLFDHSSYCCDFDVNIH